MHIAYGSVALIVLGVLGYEIENSMIFLPICCVWLKGSMDVLFGEA